MRGFLRDLFARFLTLPLKRTQGHGKRFLINAVDHRASTALCDDESNERRAAERAWKDALARSECFPNHQIAAVLAALYLGTLLIAGGLCRLIARSRPDALVRELVERYAAVPEMTLHKAIEIGALERHPQQGRGLDLGCGDGVVGGILARRAGLSELYGTDLSSLTPETIKEQGYVDYRQGDILGLPFADSSFDYAVSICVIEHIPDLEKALKEARRVLKADGAFLFTTPNPAFRDALLLAWVLRALGFRRLLEAFKTNRDYSTMHYHYYWADEWREILSRQGFREIVIEPIFSRRQLLIYDFMNIQLYVLKFYFYPHLFKWTKRPPVHRLVAWATAEVTAWALENPATEADATHYLVMCRRS